MLKVIVQNKLDLEKKTKNGKNTNFIIEYVMNFKDFKQISGIMSYSEFQGL